MSYTYTHGPNYIAWGFFNHLHLIVTHPKDLETIFNAKMTKKSHNYDFIIPWWGTGLLTSHGSKHHQRRRLITPSFHFKILERFIDVFNEQDNILVEKLRKKVENDGCEEINMYNHIAACAIDIISGK